MSVKRKETGSTSSFNKETSCCTKKSLRRRSSSRSAASARGQRGTEAQLFNGEYYFQKTDLHDRTLLDRRADFGAFWSLQDAYGSFEILQEGTLLRLTVCEGWLSVDRLFLPFLRGAKRLLMNGEALSFRFEQGYLAFEGPVQGVLEITGCC